MKTVRTPPTRCPACHKSLDAASNPDDEQTPEAGDITMCAYCTALCVFSSAPADKGFGLRLIRPEEYAELPSIHRQKFELFRALLSFSRFKEDGKGR